MHRAVCLCLLGSFFPTEESLEKEKEQQISLVTGAIVSSNCSKDQDLFCFLGHPKCKVVSAFGALFSPPCKHFCLCSACDNHWLTQRIPWELKRQHLPGSGAPYLVRYLLFMLLGFFIFFPGAIFCSVETISIMSLTSVLAWFPL